MMSLAEVNDLLASYGSGQLTEEDWQTILKLHRKYEILDKLHITSDNHDKKVKSYYKHRDTLIEEFGVYISPIYPLDNPTSILHKIYKITEKAGLNKEQIKYLFEGSIISRQRYPTLKKSLFSSDLFKHIKNQGVENNDEDIELDINEEKQLHNYSNNNILYSNNNILSKQERLLQEYHSIK
jgi:hypothetical protein